MLITTCSAKKRSRGAASELGARVAKTRSREPWQDKGEETPQNPRFTEAEVSLGANLEADWTGGE